MSSVEKEGASKLQQWQTRKLLQLQEQYDECLKDIGLGHLQAEQENEELEDIEMQRQLNRKVAKERGEKANHVLQYEKNRKSSEQAVPKQRKVISRDVENTRAKQVANIRKSPKKKAKKAEISESSEDENDVTINISGSDSEIPVLLNISSFSDSSSAQLPRKQPSKSAKPSGNRQRTASISSPTSLGEITDDITTKGLLN